MCGFGCSQFTRTIYTNNNSCHRRVHTPITTYHAKRRNREPQSLLPPALSLQVQTFFVFLAFLSLRFLGARRLDFCSPLSFEPSYISALFLASQSQRRSPDHPRCFPRHCSFCVLLRFRHPLIHCCKPSTQAFCLPSRFLFCR